MRPPSDEDLILYYYGDCAESADIEEAIESSPEVARRYESIRRVLDAVPQGETPHRATSYGAEVWDELAPRLAAQRARFESSSRRTPPHRSIGRAVGWALAATLLIVVAFWAGRQTAPAPPGGSTISDSARQRILRLAVAEHLERSQFLLQEIANEGAAASTAGTPTRIRELTAENRLYRQAARRDGNAELEAMLDELERFLTEAAHVELSSDDEWRHLADRVERTGLLFKVRVMITTLHRAETPNIPTTTT